jgi:flagellin-like protein
VTSEFLSIGEVEMKKVWKSKRGISPTLATLLLIVIAVAAVIVTYAWVMTFTGSTTDQTGALLTVENVRFQDSKYIEVTLRNSGTDDAKVESVFVGTSASNLVLQESNDVTYNPDTQIVVAGSTLNITLTESWTDGTTYHFKIATEEGFTVPFQREP